MRAVVADAGPPHYLVLIDAIDLLPRLFGTITIPDSVRRELTHDRTPERVRSWIAHPPAWLRVSTATRVSDTPDIRQLDEGERDVIAMALAEAREIILMDDRAGVAVAHAAGLRAIGTLGILEMASRRDWIDLAEALGRLRATNFRVSRTLLQQMEQRAAGRHR